MRQPDIGENFLNKPSLIMNDYFKCAKNNSFSTSNRKLLTSKAKPMVLKLS